MRGISRLCLGIKNEHINRHYFYCGCRGYLAWFVLVFRHSVVLVLSKKEKMKQTFRLVTDTARLMAVRAVQNAPEGFVVTVSEPKRSLEQNSKSHTWYAEIAQALPQHDEREWKRYCKLHHGVPILRAEDAEFKAFYDAAMKRSLTYEQKLQSMDFVPVTSIMTKGQLSRYFDAVQADFFSKGVELL